MFQLAYSRTAFAVGQLATWCAANNSKARTIAEWSKSCQPLAVHTLKSSCAVAVLGIPIPRERAPSNASLRSF